MILRIVGVVIMIIGILSVLGIVETNDTILVKIVNLMVGLLIVWGGHWLAIKFDDSEDI